MSTTLLCHAFGLRTFKYQRMEIKGGCYYFHVYKKDGFQALPEVRQQKQSTCGRKCQNDSSHAYRIPSDFCRASPEDLPMQRLQDGISGTD